MKMIEGCTLLITPYAIFMIIFHVLLHNLIRSVLDFAYHQYGICRMYSEENLENPPRVDPVCQTPLTLAAI